MTTENKTMKSDIKRAKSRPQRVPLHKQKVLRAQSREGYVNRWVNVEEDRIDRFKKAGWSPVVGKDNLDVDAIAHDTNRDANNTVMKHVGAGKQAILMEIPKEYYDEDQAAKQRRVDEIEASYSPRKRASINKNLYDESNI